MQIYCRRCLSVTPTSQPAPSVTSSISQESRHVVKHFKLGKTTEFVDE